MRHTAVKEVSELQNVDPKSNATPGYRVMHFQPFDPVSKLTRATVHKLTTDEQDEKATLVLDEKRVEVYNVMKGAPQVFKWMNAILCPSLCFSYRWFCA